MDMKAGDRGRPINGATALAQYIFGDERRRSTVYQLDRSEFGLMILGGQIVGFSGWIDAALRARASAGKKRRHRARGVDAGSEAAA